MAGSGDRALARRLTRDAVVSTRAAVRAEQSHARALRRRERALDRARRRLPTATVTTAGAAGLTLVTSTDWPLWVLAALAGVRALGAGVVLWRPPPVPALPAAASVVPPPPHHRSALFPAVKRLEAARASLAGLLPLVPAAGRGAADEAWQAAGEVDAGLRWQVARLAAVEPHGRLEPAAIAQLDAGLAAQERLVAAVADLVAASADPVVGERLQDATDALHGLAAALRELGAR